MKKYYRYLIWLLILSNTNFNSYALELDVNNSSDIDIQLNYALHVYKIKSNQETKKHQTLIASKTVVIKKNSHLVPSFQPFPNIIPKYLLPLPLIPNVISQNVYLYVFFYQINDNSANMLIGKIEQKGISINIDTNLRLTIRYFG